MRKEYPADCVERFRTLRRKIRQDCLACLLESWHDLVSNRRAELLCSVRIMHHSIRDMQGSTFSEWSWVAKNGARPDAITSPGRPGMMEILTTTSPILYQQSPNSRSFSASPPRRTSSGSWFFGLFGRDSTPSQNDASLVQEKILVHTPDFPAHVQALWPDLDLKSFVVCRPDQKQPINVLMRKAGISSKDAVQMLTASNDNVEGAIALARRTPSTAHNAAFAQMREDLRQAELLKVLVLASRERVERLGMRQPWLKTSGRTVVLSDLSLAKRLLLQSDDNTSRALAAFTVEYVGDAAAREADKRVLKQVFPAWHVLYSRNCAQKMSEGKLQTRRILTLKSCSLRVWRQVSRRSRALLNIAAVLWLKSTRTLLRSVISHWKDAAQNQWDPDDDGLIEQVLSPDTAEGLTQLLTLSSNAGRAVLGQRGVAAGISVASALGGFLIGSERFRAVVSNFSPSPPNSPTRPFPKSPDQSRRAATMSPEPTSAAAASRGGEWSMSPLPQQFRGGSQGAWALDRNGPTLNGAPPSDTATRPPVLGGVAGSRAAPAPARSPTSVAANRQSASKPAHQGQQSLSSTRAAESRGGGLGSSTILKKFNEPYAPS